jgi:hypothetical protein
MELRHNLYLRNQSAQSSNYTLRFKRELSTNLNNYTTIDLPDRLLVSVLKLEDIYTTNTPVHFTLYKPSSQTCSTKYSSSPTSCQSLEVLETSDMYRIMYGGYTKFVVKAMSGDTCVNCNSSNLPKTILPTQKAYSSTQLFGPTNTETTMRAGLASMDTTTENYLRTYFALPSRADLNTLQAYSLSNNPAANLSISWVRPTISQSISIDGVWAGTISCTPNSSFTNFNDAGNLWAQASDSYTWTDVGKFVKQSGFVGIGFTSKVADGHFVSGLETLRSCSS